MFCKTCGTLLVPLKTPYGKWMSCPEGHPQPEVNRENVILKEQNKSQVRIEVDTGENHLAVHDHVCKKCKFDKAELIERSCAYSDEDNIYQMKCGKCGFIEQLEGKVK